MNAALVKIDVAAALLRLSAKALFELADGSPKAHLPALVYVFNLATKASRPRRDLRFWLAEIQAHAQGEPARYAALNLPDVIGRILPATRKHFHAGEVDQLFQIRHCTRLAFPDLAGAMQDRRSFYGRAELAAFLQRRWLGASVPALNSFGIANTSKRCAAVADGHSRRSPSSAGARRSLSRIAEWEPGGGGNQLSPLETGGSPSPPGSHAQPKFN